VPRIFSEIEMPMSFVVSGAGFQKTRTGASNGQYVQMMLKDIQK
jgi:hypothetical protein